MLFVPPARKFFPFLLSPVLFVMVGFVLLFVSNSYAIENIKKKIVKVGYVTGVGITRDYGAENPHGYIYNILDQLSKISHFKFVYFPFNTRAAMLSSLKNGQIDMAGPVVKNSETLNNFLFTSDAVGTAQAMLVTKDRKTFPYYDDPASLNGKTVASYYGNPFEQELNAYCEKNNIKIKYLRKIPSDYDTIEADLYLVSNLFGAFKDYFSVINLESFNFYFVFNKNNNSLHADMLDAFLKLTSTDGNFFHEMYLSHFSNSLTRRYLTRNEMELLHGKVFTVGYVSGHPPLQFTNEEGLPDGISIEVLNVLAEKYGFSVNYVPYSPDGDRAIHENFDMILSLIGERDHLKNFYNITDEYIRLSLMLVLDGGRSLIDDVKNRDDTIGILNYVFLEHSDIVKEFKNANIIFYNSVQELIQAYHDGHVQSALMSSAGVNLVNKLVTSDFDVLGTNIHLPFKILISKKLPFSYVEIFNIILDHTNKNEFSEIITRQTLNIAPELTISNMAKEFYIEICVFIILLGLSISLMVISFKNRRRKEVLEAVKYDELTGFITHKFFESNIKEILKTASPGEYEFLSIDIDSFKTITTYYNYDHATKVIQVMAHALNEALMLEKNMITRIYADNFVVFRKTSHAKDIEIVINDFVLPRTEEFLGENYHLSLSVGIYVIQNCDDKIHSMIDFADTARHKGKDTLDTTYFYFDDHMMREYNHKLNITFRMEKALRDNEFKLIFQPKVNFQTLKIEGAEGLVRWIGSDGETVYPSDFIPVFEQNGFIAKLDLYVFAKVCRFIKENSLKMDIPLLSANLSARTMLEDGIATHLKEIADKFEVDTGRIELEVTESAMVEEFALGKVKELKDAGFVVSIDDFGTGASSLNRLSAMDTDILKLDKAFLDMGNENKRNEIVVKQTIEMAKKLNIRTVAEGVETAGQAHWLRQLGCDYAQGYYFARPMTEEDFKELLLAGKTYIIEN